MWYETQCLPPLSLPEVYLVSSNFGLLWGNWLSYNILFCILFETENISRIHNSKTRLFKFWLLDLTWRKKKLKKQVATEEACIYTLFQIILPMNTCSYVCQEILILVYADYIIECKPLFSQIKSPETFQMYLTSRFESAINHKAYNLINPESLQCSTWGVLSWQNFILLQAKKSC